MIFGKVCRNYHKIELLMSQLPHRLREVAIHIPKLWCEILLASGGKANLGNLYWFRCILACFEEFLPTQYGAIERSNITTAAG